MSAKFYAGVLVGMIYVAVVIFLVESQVVGLNGSLIAILAPGLFVAFLGLPSQTSLLRGFAGGFIFLGGLKMFALFMAY